MSDEHDIRQTIQTYFDGMHESSADKTRAAFHPNATLTGYLEDGLHEMSVTDFADFVAGQSSHHRSNRAYRHASTSFPSRSPAKQPSPASVTTTSA